MTVGDGAMFLKEGWWCFCIEQTQFSSQFCLLCSASLLSHQLTHLAAGRILSLLGWETARPIHVHICGLLVLLSPAPSELWLLCPSLGGCQVLCRASALMRQLLLDKINRDPLIHSEAGQLSRAAWKDLIRSATIVLPGRVVWWLVQHVQCKWLVATTC